MHDCQDGMTPNHFRPGETHDLSDGLPPFRLITVNRAIGADWFLFLERAFFNLAEGILLKILALTAQASASGMAAMAVDGDHIPHCPLFSIHPDFCMGFCENHLWTRSITVTSGGARKRIGGPHVPEPRLTYRMPFIPDLE